MTRTLTFAELFWEEHAAAMCGGAKSSDEACEIAAARLFKAARMCALEEAAVIADGWDFGETIAKEIRAVIAAETQTPKKELTP